MAAVGLNYQGELRDFIAQHLDLLDYVELVPDIAWTDRGPEATNRYVDDRATVAFIDQIADAVPIVAHSIGLSIASAHRFRTEHVDQIRRWDERFDFAWHSDHLGYNVVADPERPAAEFTVGVPLPLPLDDDVLDLVVERAIHVQQAVAKRFLLENNSAYVRVPGDRYRWAQFLNLLCARSGCGLLLDLHNLYVDGRNCTEDVDAFLSELDLDNVVEIHLAGGLTYGDHYLDAHSGGVPDDVWKLAADVIPACPALRGVTFELLGSWFGRFGEAALLDTIAGMRELVG